VILLSLDAKLKQAAARLKADSVLKALRGVQELRRNLNRNTNVKLALENYFVSYIPSKKQKV